MWKFDTKCLWHICICTVLTQTNKVVKHCNIIFYFLYYTLFLHHNWCTLLLFSLNASHFATDFTWWSHCLHVHNEKLQTPLVCISTGHLFAPKYVKKTRMVTYYCNFNIGFYQLFSALTRTFLIRPSLIGDANPIDHLRPIWWRSLSWTTPVKLEKSTVCHS